MDLLKHFLWTTGGYLHLIKGADASFTGFEFKLFIEGLHLLRGGDDSLGRMFGSLLIGGGLLIGNRKDHKFRFFKSGKLRRKSKKIIGAMSRLIQICYPMDPADQKVFKILYSGTKMAAATTEVQSPFLSPSAD